MNNFTAHSIPLRALTGEEEAQSRLFCTFVENQSISTELPLKACRRSGDEGRFPREYGASRSKRVGEVLEQGRGKIL